MPDLEGIIGIMITLFIVVLLGYVFFLVLYPLSAALAILFIIVITLIVFGILYGIFKGD